MLDNAAHRRRHSRTVKLAGGAAAAAVVAGGAFAFAGSAATREVRRERHRRRGGRGHGGHRLRAVRRPPLTPSCDLLKSAQGPGVKDCTLAFVTAGRGCTPKWGGAKDRSKPASWSIGRRPYAFAKAFVG